MFWDGVGSCITFVFGVALMILIGFVTDSFDNKARAQGYFCLQFLMCFNFLLALACAGVVKF